jgi:NTE family protein
MARTRIAIACQGGGSQTAFTAGALSAMCKAGVHDEFEIVSISGTSGGAVCAALIWFALEKNESQPWQRLMDFWQDNAAQGWAEQSINQWTIDSIRLANKGLVPTFQFSPASPFVQAVSGFASMGQRENFRNFHALLETHIDFAEIATWGPCSKRPILIIGAANVISGKLAKFN